MNVHVIFKRYVLLVFILWLEMESVTMIPTMQNVTMMVETAVGMVSIQTIAPTVHAISKIFVLLEVMLWLAMVSATMRLIQRSVTLMVETAVQQLPQQLSSQIIAQIAYVLEDVTIFGKEMGFVMMKITMLVVTMIVEIAVEIIQTQTIAHYVNV